MLHLVCMSVHVQECLQALTGGRSWCGCVVRRAAVHLVRVVGTVGITITPERRGRRAVVMGHG